MQLGSLKSENQGQAGAPQKRSSASSAALSGCWLPALSGPRHSPRACALTLSRLRSSCQDLFVRSSWAEVRKATKRHAWQAYSNYLHFLLFPDFCGVASTVSQARQGRAFFLSTGSCHAVPGAGWAQSAGLEARPAPWAQPAPGTAWQEPVDKKKARPCRADDCTADVPVPARKSFHLWVRRATQVFQNHVLDVSVVPA